MTVVPPHRQYAFPVVSRADVEWQMARADVRSILGDDLPALAHRTGLAPTEALNLLAMAPRWLLTGVPS
ncbi:hypothetical protein [Streptomyces sp. NPDC052179]|uniref:hypothetical protein n=1 Tax=Streptomyces sp. NPDC052179 TaxID=3155680 RepID=UPI00342D4706